VSLLLAPDQRNSAGFRAHIGSRRQGAWIIRTNQISAGSRTTRGKSARICVALPLDQRSAVARVVEGFGSCSPDG